MQPFSARLNNDPFVLSVSNSQKSFDIFTQTFAIEKGRRHTLKLGASKITTSSGLLLNFSLNDNIFIYFLTVFYIFFIFRPFSRLYWPPASLPLAPVWTLPSFFTSSRSPSSSSREMPDFLSGSNSLG